MKLGMKEVKQLVKHYCQTLQSRTSTSVLIMNNNNKYQKLKYAMKLDLKELIQ